MGGNLTFNDNDDVQLKGATDGTLVGNSGNKLLVDGSGVTQPVSGTVTGNQGTAGTAANGWPTKTTDGTDIALVTTNGDQKVVDGVRNGGVYGLLSVPTANTPVEVKVGAGRLAQRKLVYIYSNNNGLFWGLDNTVTTTSGFPLVNGQVVSFSVDPDSTFQVWLVGSTNGKSAQIAEVP